MRKVLALVALILVPVVADAKDKDLKRPICLASRSEVT
jgi:hypothetical protein